MKIINKIQWLNKYVSGDKPIITDYLLFNHIIISRHFKGFQDGGFRITLLKGRGIYTFSFKHGLEIDKTFFFDSPIENTKLTIRFNKPFFTFYFNKVNLKHVYRLVEVV